VIASTMGVRALELFATIASCDKLPSDRMWRLRLLNSAMAFTGWRLAKDDISNEMLSSGLCYRVAFICELNQVGLDCFIPLAIPALKSAVVNTGSASVEVSATPVIPQQLRPEGVSSSSSSRPQLGSGSSGQAPSSAPARGGKRGAGAVSGGRRKRLKVERPGDPAAAVAPAEPCSSSSSSSLPLPLPSPSPQVDSNVTLQGRNDYAVGSMSVNAKNYTNNIYLSQAIKFCSNQRDHVVKKTKCGGTISVLMMVGKGKVILKKSGDAVGTYSSMMVLLNEWPNDIFLILNDFPGVDGDVKKLLTQIASASSLHATVTESLESVVTNVEDTARNMRTKYIQSTMAKLDLSSPSPAPPEDVVENLFADLQGEGSRVSELKCGDVSLGVLIANT